MPVSAPAVSVSKGLVGSALTIVTKVAPAHRATLASLLTRIGADIDGSREMEFDRLSTVHFMRWVVIEGLAPGDPALLAFESNYDGTLDEHLDDLYLNGARCMHEVYRCCEGYPLGALEPPAVPGASFEFSAAERGRAKWFLKGAMLDYSAFYVGRRGKAARRIRAEAAIRDAVQAFLDQRGSDPSRTFRDAAAAYDAILEHLKAEHQNLLDELAEPATPPERRVAPAALRILALALPLLPVLVPLYAILRFKEATDLPESFDVLPEQTRELAEREDFQVQNQLTHLVPVKPGPFRLFTLKLVFYAIDTLARFYYNQGDLGGLSTIHYARWVLIDGGKRLLFFSNYDGSWERYLGDFVDQAHVGLTAVWSNTSGFPKTANLVQQGAEDEERFKSWTRAHQIPTQLWYSAYKTLTTLNIANNTALAAGLVRRPQNEPALERWLALL